MTVQEKVSQSRLDDSTKDAIEYVYKTLTLAKETLKELMDFDDPTIEQVIEVYDRIADKKWEYDLKNALDKEDEDI